MQVSLIDEGDYGRQMRDVVLPALAGCRHEGWMPPTQVVAVRGGDIDAPGEDAGDDTVDEAGAGTVHDTVDDAGFQATDGADGGHVSTAPNALHYVCYDASEFDQLSIPGASGTFRGSIVIAHGFTEFAAKYAEMAWYFLLAGYSVCILEQRGHGFSPHEVSDPNLVWIDDWRRYAEDLAKFARTVGRSYSNGKPMHLYAHSMGGGVGAAVLEKYPSLFDRAVLSSPMIEPVTGMPAALAAPTSALATAIGLGKRRAPGQKDFPRTFDMSRSQGASEPRVRSYFEMRSADAHYQTNAATFGWVAQAFAMSRSILDRESCARVQTPILLFQAGRDTWVRNEVQNRFVQSVRAESGDVVLERIEPSVHEIFSMPNDVLGHYLERIFDFLAESIDEMIVQAQ
ncbi:lysophospholipase [Bifidobacterium bohemicum]|uniref:Lysophospholipase L2 n=1 Tax=Bifidobacterium bohemicum DSM 22767 TaxID=1437606 RepID=A0A086ZEQ5_9BIFI|nr:alpha/beta hydrolase [Bifidobacterium bohemicum]KFI45005.1 lysophospholipase L2 [Bifidobacterium bohemicum DSM 22767]SCC13107.1 lysophospholipase [Bifidobacterium bohemicum]